MADSLTVSRNDAYANIGDTIRLLDAGLASLVAIDDARGEPKPLGLWHVQGNVARGGGEVPVVVAEAIGLAVGSPLVALGADRVVGLLGQQGFQSVLDGFLTSSDRSSFIASWSTVAMGADTAMPP